jgi:hypothetical protein
MLTIPFLALTAYIYDVYTLLMSEDESAGLLSSVLFIFYFLQYSPTINSKLALTVYHFLIWMMVTVGDILYIPYYLRQNNRIQQIRYVGYIFLDFIFILVLWSCKMIAVCKVHDKCYWFCTKIFQHLQLNSNVRLHIKVHQKQFFSFVSRLETILASVTTEWLYYVTLKTIYLEVSGILEFLATCCCCLFIIMQFFPSHFHAKYRQI